MLHITNGDAAGALISKANLGGDMLPWNDVLHEGAVRDGLTLEELSEERAQFIAACGWGELNDVRAEFRSRNERLKRSADEEVVLWFEHDLYDQLQLIQLLDWFADRNPTKLTLICVGEHENVADFHGLGQLNQQQMSELFPLRREVTPEQFALARRAWAAFGAEDPRGIEWLLEEGTNALPFLRAALLRHLQQFPSASNGLSRTESNILRALDARGRCAMPELFEASQAEEESRFLGDSTFAQMYLEPLCRCAVPAVRSSVGGEIFEITDTGRAALREAEDHIERNGIDCWRGGAHLHGVATWRWHEADQRLVCAVD